MIRILVLTAAIVLPSLGAPIAPGSIVSNIGWVNQNTRIEVQAGERVTAYAEEKYTAAWARGNCPHCSPEPTYISAWAYATPEAHGSSFAIDVLTYSGELMYTYDLLFQRGGYIMQNNTTTPISDGSAHERPLDYAALFADGTQYRMDFRNTSTTAVTLISLGGNTGSQWMGSGSNPTSPYSQPLTLSSQPRIVANPEPGTWLMCGSALVLVGYRRLRSATVLQRESRRKCST